MNRIITAKFSSLCAETGIRIKKGDPILYDPTAKKAYCRGSMAYQNHSTDPAAGAIQANEDAYFDNWCQRNGI